MELGRDDVLRKQHEEAGCAIEHTCEERSVVERSDRDVGAAAGVVRAGLVRERKPTAVRPI